MTDIKTREKELWEKEGEIAIRVVEWFSLFRKLRKAADTVPPDLVIEQLKRADPEMLAGAHIWLMNFLQDRFSSEKRTIETRKVNQANAAKRTCPYTRRQYDAAVAKVGTKQEALAMRLGVSRDTIRKYGRPNK